MKRAEFKEFKEQLITAEKENVIFQFGFLWLNLTDKQVKEITPIIATKHYVKTELDLENNKAIYTLPCGISIISFLEG